MKVAVIFTCFNRKSKTIDCIQRIVNSNPSCRFSFIVTDDGSTDGTHIALEKLKKKYDITVLEGDGNLFYSGGMHMGMEYLKNKHDQKYEYVLLINDDVYFYPHSIETMISQSKEQKDAVIVGAIQNEKGSLSYGAIKYLHGIKYRYLTIKEWYKPADTFNGNCVLIAYIWFNIVKTMDNIYRHSLGDFDYGLSLKRSGAKIYSSKEYIGMCNRNTIKNTWLDKSLGKLERIKKKEDLKGAPIKQWFYFLKKNFGILTAIKSSLTPYIRIFLNR